MADKKISHKDVEIAFYVNGLEGVKAKQAEGASQGTLTKALDRLNAAGQDTGDLSVWMAEMFPNKGQGNRGRSAPKVGDVRQYAAGKNGVVVSHNTLDLVEGQKVQATFGEDENGAYVVLRAGNLPQ